MALFHSKVGTIARSLFFLTKVQSRSYMTIHVLVTYWQGRSNCRLSNYSSPWYWQIPQGLSIVSMYISPWYDSFLLLHVVRLVRARSDHYSLVRAKLGPTTLSTQFNEITLGVFHRPTSTTLLLLINNDFKLQRCTGNYFCLVSHIPVITYKPATTTTTAIIPHHKCKSVCCTLLCKIVCTSISVLNSQSIKWRKISFQNRF